MRIASDSVPLGPEFIRGIRFVREQDGIPEQDFKDAIIPVLAVSVRRAYLACVEYTNSTTTAVALCIRSTTPEEALVRKIGVVFSSMFGTNQHLDIVFLSDEQERCLECVCCPFFETAS